METLEQQNKALAKRLGYDDVDQCIRDAWSSYPETLKTALKETGFKLEKENSENGVTEES